MLYHRGWRGGLCQERSCAADVLRNLASALKCASVPWRILRHCAQLFGRPASINFAIRCISAWRSRCPRSKELTCSSTNVLYMVVSFVCRSLCSSARSKPCLALFAEWTTGTLRWTKKVTAGGHVCYTRATHSGGSDARRCRVWAAAPAAAPHTRPDPGGPGSGCLLRPRHGQEARVRSPPTLTPAGRPARRCAWAGRDRASSLSRGGPGECSP